MNLLVTGATGFVGSACVRAALARGHRVAGLVRTETRRSSSKLLPGRVTWIEGDLAHPDWKALGAFGADVCLHTAWVTTHGENLTSRANHDYVRWSIDFLGRLAQMGMQHCVALGTCIEYAPQHGPMNELTSPVAPNTLYGQCKDELRRSLAGAAFDLCWARLFYAYGPGEDPRRLATSVVRRVMEGQDIALKTPNSTKDYIFIEDVADALLTSAEQRFRGVLNLGTGAGVTVLQITEAIARILGKKAHIIVPEIIADPYDCVIADTTRLTSLGWKPRYNLDAGLTALISHLTSPSAPLN